MLECGRLDRTEVTGLDRQPVINIDHHAGNAMYGTLNWFDPSAAACAEMVHDLIAALGVPLTPVIGAALYAGIITDTGSFRHANITARTFETCRNVAACGVDVADLAAAIYQNSALGKLRLTGRLLHEMRIEAGGRVAILHVDDALLRNTGCPPDDMEGVINLPLEARDVQAVIMLKALDGVTRVSLRSKGLVDVPRRPPRRSAAAVIAMRRAVRSRLLRRASSRSCSRARSRPSTGRGRTSRPRRSPEMDGVLVVDKPPGLTSHDVVAHARRALGVRRVGHLGTLDPIATGVLPLVVGRATRLASLLSAGRKTYDGRILLGISTDTYDTTGRITADARDRMGANLVNAPDRQAIEHVIETFVGTRPQRPPPFSAKKVRGVRAYKLARKNRPVAPEAVEVTVQSIEVLAVEGAHVRCRVICDPGFYMRALAHDLGVALGCGACLEALRRERNGAFDLRGAVPLEEIEARGPAITERMVPLDALLPEFPRLVLTEQGARRALHGNDLTAADVVSASAEWTAPAAAAGGVVAKLHDGQGVLIAIAKADAGRLLHPTIVLV